MTILNVTQGCFGSAVIYRASAPECLACAVQTDCAARVKASQSAVLESVKRFDALFQSDKADSVARWFGKRFQRVSVAQKTAAASQDRLRKWSDAGVNAYLVKHRINPVDEAGDQILRAAFAFVIEVEGFTVRDLAEHLRETFPDMSKRSSSVAAKEICDALKEAKILKLESRNVLCLN